MPACGGALRGDRKPAIARPGGHRTNSKLTGFPPETVWPVEVSVPVAMIERFSGQVADRTLYAPTLAKTTCRDRDI